MARTWKQLVAAGRKLQSQQDSLQWRWGDLGLEVVPWEGKPGGGQKGWKKPGEGKTRPHDQQVKTRLEKWLEEVGSDLAFSTIHSYRRVAYLWPKDKRGWNCPYTVYATLTFEKDRFNVIRDGMTCREAARLVGQGHHGKKHPESATKADCIVWARAGKSFTRTAIKAVELHPEWMKDPGFVELLHQASTEIEEEAYQLSSLLDKKLALVA